MTDGPRLNDTRIVRTELNNGTVSYSPEVYTWGTTFFQPYWKTLIPHAFETKMNDYGTLKYAQTAIDSYIRELKRQEQFKTKSVTYIKYP